MFAGSDLLQKHCIAFYIAIKVSENSHLYTDISFVALAIIPIYLEFLCVVILLFWIYKFAGLSVFLLMKYVRRKQLPEKEKKATAITVVYSFTLLKMKRVRNNISVRREVENTNIIWCIKFFLFFV